MSNVECRVPLSVLTSDAELLISFDFNSSFDLRPATCDFRLSSFVIRHSSFAILLTAPGSCHSIHTQLLIQGPLTGMRSAPAGSSGASKAMEKKQAIWISG